MNSKTDKEPTPEVHKKGFFASLFSRLDRAMKEAADKKASGCCCSGDTKKDSSGKGGKCC